MNPIFGIAAAMFGFIIGGLFVSRVAAWGYAVTTAFRERHTSGRPRLLWLLPTVLHSGPWLLAGGVYFTYHIFSGPHAAWWPWFYGGVAFAPLFIGANVIALLRRQRRRLENDTVKENHAG